MLYGGKSKWEILTEALETLGTEKCTKQPAQNAVKNAKFHSSQQKADLFTAENVIRKRKGFNLL
jgi:hypothetical protein